MRGCRRARRSFNQPTEWPLGLRGFTLVEVLVATGLVAGLSLVIAQVLTNMHYSIGRAEQVSNTNDFKSLIKNTLSSPLSCITTVGQLAAVSQNPDNPTPLTQLRQGQRDSGGNVVTIVMYPTAAHGSPPGYPNAGRYGSLRNIRLGVATTSPLAPNLSNLDGWFVVRFDISTPSRTNTSGFRVPLKFTTDNTGRLNGCYATSTDFCGVVGGTLDTATGLCNQIDLLNQTTNGSIRGNGVVTAQGTPLPNGTRGFNFANDPQTGLFRTGSPNPGQGALGLYANNSEVVRIDSATRRVGINTTTPTNQLDVRGGVAVGSYAGANTAPSGGMIISGAVGIGTQTVGRNKLVVNGHADFAGNVGINTTSPNSALDVDGGKIYMRNQTQDSDPSYTVVTKGYAHRNLFASKGMCNGNQVLIGFDNNGNPICGSTDAITTRNCPPGYYLIGYVGGTGQSGNQVCVPLSNIGACGAKQYMVGVDASGSRICKTLYEVGVCGAGTTLAGFNGSGNPVCTNKAQGGSCPSGQAAVGVNWNGSPICGNKAAGGTCGVFNTPGGVINGVVIGITTAGAPICGPPPTSSGGTAKVLYQCPRVDTGCGKGDWWSQGCVGQLSTTTTTCMNVTWTSTWCQQNYGCSQIGTINVE